MSLFGILTLTTFPAFAQNQAPQVIVIQGDQLRRSDGHTVVEQNLQKLKDDFGVQITTHTLAGYILDTNDTSESYEGYDIESKFANPYFGKYFHNPDPSDKDAQKALDAVWSYATKGVKPADGIDKAYSAVALTEIDHVYFGQRKFGDTYYYNPKTQQKDDAGMESVLHEALHVWHSHHLKEVSDLLHSKGSYFDKVEISKSVCTNFLKESEQFDQKPVPVCGFANRQQAMLAVLSKGKWPQRYGSITDREEGLIKKSAQCTQEKSHTEKIGNDLLCMTDGYGGAVGDMHSLDNDMEYFAILMQLYVFSPQDFRRVATPNEAAFAKKLFATEFHDVNPPATPAKINGTAQ